MNDLFPEEELRAFLKATPESPPDPGFEAAVAAQIRLQQRRARLIPIAVILAAAAAVAVIALLLVPSILLQWMQLPSMLLPIAQALAPVTDTIGVFVACAPPLFTNILVQFGPYLCATVVFTAALAFGFRLVRRTRAC